MLRPGGPDEGGENGSCGEVDIAPPRRAGYRSSKRAEHRLWLLQASAVFRMAAISSCRPEGASQSSVFVFTGICKGRLQKRASRGVWRASALFSGGTETDGATRISGTAVSGAETGRDAVSRDCVSGQWRDDCCRRLIGRGFILHDDRRGGCPAVDGRRKNGSAG